MAIKGIKAVFYHKVDLGFSKVEITSTTELHGEKKEFHRDSKVAY